jgi:hypothetical protein
VSENTPSGRKRILKQEDQKQKMKSDGNLAIQTKNKSK